MIADALRSADKTQGWLGMQVAEREGRDNPYTQASVSGWLDRIEEQPPARVFYIEAVLGMKAGHLSRRLGYLPVDAKPARSVEDALEADDSIPDALVHVILGAVREARKGGS